MVRRAVEPAAIAAVRIAGRAQVLRDTSASRRAWSRSGRPASSRSNISLRCSSKASGVPTGASGTLAARRPGVLIEDRLDAPFDLANVVEIAVHAQRGRMREALFCSATVCSRIESRMLRSSRLRRRRCSVGAAVAEELFEHHLRAVLHRQRNGGRAPGDRVEVGAAVAGAAAQADVLDAQLERRQRRVLTDVLPRRSDPSSRRRARHSSADGRRSGRSPPSARARRRRRRRWRWRDTGC